MLTAPGREARKNSFSGGVLENNAVEFICFPAFFSLFLYHFFISKA